MTSLGFKSLKVHPPILSKLKLHHSPINLKFKKRTISSPKVTKIWYKNNNPPKNFLFTFFYHQTKMAVHLCLIVLIVVVFTDANSLGRIPTSADDFDNNKYISYADESFPRKELIKILQSRILKELNLSEDVLDKEDGTSEAAVPPLSENAVRLLMHNEEKKQLRKIIVQPLNYSKFFIIFPNNK